MHGSLVKFRSPDDFLVFRLTKIASVERFGRRQLLITEVQDKCRALWYKTSVQHCGTREMFSTVIQDKC
jgi:hypothetical protein